MRGRDGFCIVGIVIALCISLAIAQCPVVDPTPFAAAWIGATESVSAMGILSEDAGVVTLGVHNATLGAAYVVLMNSTAPLPGLERQPQVVGNGTGWSRVLAVGPARTWSSACGLPDLYLVAELTSGAAQLVRCTPTAVGVYPDSQCVGTGPTLGTLTGKVGVRVLAGPECPRQVAVSHVGNASSSVWVYRNPGSAGQAPVLAFDSADATALAWGPGATRDDLYVALAASGVHRYAWSGTLLGSGVFLFDVSGVTQIEVAALRGDAVTPDVVVSHRLTPHQWAVGVASAPAATGTWTVDTAVLLSADPSLPAPIWTLADVNADRLTDIALWTPSDVSGLVWRLAVAYNAPLGFPLWSAGALDVLVETPFASPLAPVVVTLADGAPAVTTWAPTVLDPVLRAVSAVTVVPGTVQRTRGVPTAGTITAIAAQVTTTALDFPLAPYEARSRMVVAGDTAYLVFDSSTQSLALGTTVSTHTLSTVWMGDTTARRVVVAVAPDEVLIFGDGSAPGSSTPQLGVIARIPDAGVRAAAISRVSEGSTSRLTVPVMYTATAGGCNERKIQESFAINPTAAVHVVSPVEDATNVVVSRNLTSHAKRVVCVGTPRPLVAPFWNYTANVNVTRPNSTYTPLITVGHTPLRVPASLLTTIADTDVVAVIDNPVFVDANDDGHTDVVALFRGEATVGPGNTTSSRWALLLFSLGEEDEQVGGAVVLAEGAADALGGVRGRDAAAVLGRRLYAADVNLDGTDDVVVLAGNATAGTVQVHTFLVDPAGPADPGDNTTWLTYQAWPEVAVNVGETPVGLVRVSSLGLAGSDLRWQVITDDGASSRVIPLSAPAPATWGVTTTRAEPHFCGVTGPCIREALARASPCHAVRAHISPGLYTGWQSTSPLMDDTTRALTLIGNPRADVNTPSSSVDISDATVELVDPPVLVSLIGSGQGSLAHVFVSHATSQSSLASTHPTPVSLIGGALASLHATSLVGYSLPSDSALVSVATNGGSFLALASSFTGNTMAGALDNTAGLIRPSHGHKTVWLQDTTFADNTVEGAGGVLYQDAGGAAVATFTAMLRCTFARNSARYGGVAAVYRDALGQTPTWPLDLDLAAIPYVETPLLTSVPAVTSLGAAVRAGFVGLAMDGCAWDGNHADGAGGILYVCQYPTLMVGSTVGDVAPQSAGAGGVAFTCTDASLKNARASIPIAAPRGLYMDPTTLDALTNVFHVNHTVTAYGPRFASLPVAVEWADTPPVFVPSGVAYADQVVHALDAFAEPAVIPSITLELLVTVSGGPHITERCDSLASLDSSTLTFGPTTTKFPADEQTYRGRLLAVTARTSDEALSTAFSANLTVCPPGMGRSSEIGEPLVCAVCPLGTISEVLSTDLCVNDVTCRAGDVFFDGECIGCPDNTLRVASNGTLDPSLIVDRDQIPPCMCDVTYWVPTGEPDVACVACPQGGYCTGGLAQPRALPGWWDISDAQDGSLFAQCLRKDACVGYARGGCSSATRGFMCNDCATNHYTDPTGRCVVCPDAAMGTLVAWVAAVLIAGCSAALIVAWESSAQNSDTSDDKMAVRLSGNVPRTAGMLLLALQIVGAIGASSLEWPAIIRGFLSFFNILNLDVRAFAVECNASHFSVLFPISLGVIPLFVGSAVVTTVVVQVLWRVPTPMLALCERTLLSSMPFLALNVIRNLASVVDCTRTPRNQYVMDADPSVVCFSPGWWANVFPAAAVAGLAMLGLVGYHAGSIWWAQQHGHTRLAFLWQRYRLHCAYHSLVPYARAVAVTIGTVFFSTWPVWLCGVMVLTLLVSAFFITARQPNLIPLLNRVGATLDIFLLLLIAIGFAFFADRFPGDATRVFAHMLVVGAVLALCGVAGWGMIQEARILTNRTGTPIDERLRNHFWDTTFRNASDWLGEVELRELDQLRQRRGRGLSTAEPTITASADPLFV